MRRTAVGGGVELEHSFWRSYVHVGVVSYLLGGVAVFGYAVGTRGPHWTALVVLDVASMVATITVFWWIGLRLVETRWRTPFFVSWTLSTYLFIGVGLGLDGGTRSPMSYLLVMPLLFAGLAYSTRTVATLTVVGVAAALTVGLTTADGTTADTALLATAMAVAGLLTSAMARNRARLTDALVEAANHDSLTGCTTRRAFYDRLHHEARRAQRYGTPFTLVLADLDDLKGLNDRGGHEAGDEALRTLAGALRRASRGTDLVGRLGGDEFAVILPESDSVAGAMAADRLLLAVHEADGDGHLTASFGVSTWRGDDDSVELLVRRADEGLYAAKRAGRDRLVTDCGLPLRTRPETA